MAGASDQISDQNSDDELIAVLTKNGDEFQKSQARTAFEVLFERHASLVLGYCTRILKDRSKAEDVAQEIWMKIIRYAPQYKAQGQFRPWILSIARTTSLNVIRAQREWTAEYNEVTFDASEGPNEEPFTNGNANTSSITSSFALGPIEPLLKRSTHIELRDAIQELPELQRTAICLKWIEELSYEETADAMRVSLANVKSLLHRAKNTLEEKLGVATLADASPNLSDRQGRKP